ncbi:MAG: hypothetical protein Q8R28_15365 [Dehalococcoidia bacterium]|nr:hypothetical protein [Dehalococcoidia bacterium]
MPSIELPRLPVFTEVGGNTRHASVWARVRAYQQERDAWRELLALARYPTYQQALIPSKAELRITLHFKGTTSLNYENALYACKTLIDLTEIPRVVFAKDSKGQQVPREKGWLGWVKDDSQYEWPWHLTKRENSSHAPLTVLEVAPL